MFGPRKPPRTLPAVKTDQSNDYGKPYRNGSVKPEKAAANKDPKTEKAGGKVLETEKAAGGKKPKDKAPSKKISTKKPKDTASEGSLSPRSKRTSSIASGSWKPGQTQNPRTDTRKATTKARGFDKKEKNESNSGRLPMVAPAFALTKENSQFFDCMILTKGKEKLYCHQSVLAMWSPTLAEMFQEGEEEEVDEEEGDEGEGSLFVVDMRERRSKDVKVLLESLYPPNKAVTDRNVTVLLPLAKEYQMQELTSQCEKFLLKKRGNWDLLLKSQEYILPELRKKCVEVVKTCPLQNMSVTREYRLLEKVNVIELLLARLHWLEAEQVSLKKRGEDTVIKLEEMQQIFSNVYGIWKMKGQNLKPIRDEIMSRADSAMKTLKEDAPSNLRPFTKPEKQEDAAQAQSDSSLKSEQKANDNSGQNGKA